MEIIDYIVIINNRLLAPSFTRERNEAASETGPEMMSTCCLEQFGKYDGRFQRVEGQPGTAPPNRPPAQNISLRWDIKSPLISEPR